MAGPINFNPSSASEVHAEPSASATSPVADFQHSEPLVVSNRSLTADQPRVEFDPNGDITPVAVQSTDKLAELTRALDKCVKFQSEVDRLAADFIREPDPKKAAHLFVDLNKNVEQLKIEQGAAFHIGSAVALDAGSQPEKPGYWLPIVDAAIAKAIAGADKKGVDGMSSSALLNSREDLSKEIVKLTGTKDHPKGIDYSAVLDELVSGKSLNGYDRSGRRDMRQLFGIRSSLLDSSPKNSTAGANPVLEAPPPENPAEAPLNPQDAPLYLQERENEQRLQTDHANETLKPSGMDAAQSVIQSQNEDAHELVEAGVPVSLPTPASEVAAARLALGLNENSSGPEISAAIRRAQFRHPDKNIGKDTTEEFQCLNDNIQIVKAWSKANRPHVPPPPDPSGVARPPEQLLIEGGIEGAGSIPRRDSVDRIDGFSTGNSQSLEEESDNDLELESSPPAFTDLNTEMSEALKNPKDHVKKITDMLEGIASEELGKKISGVNYRSLKALSEDRQSELGSVLVRFFDTN
jgi:hypothetical protein